MKVNMTTAAMVGMPSAADNNLCLSCYFSVKWASLAAEEVHKNEGRGRQKASKQETQASHTHTEAQSARQTRPNAKSRPLLLNTTRNNPA